MLADTVQDYAQYLKVDLSSNFQTVQDVIDNMITRLEELSSVVQMIKLKNNNCTTSVTQDICRNRNEVTMLSKKIVTLSDVVHKLQVNVEVLEKRVERAESDFGVQSDNKLKYFFKPFLKRKDVGISTNAPPIPQEKVVFSSVLDNFETSNT
ncbi:cappuccino protein [Danaus plexippus plexippus]|uniref:Cappuccino protein n=1 Tax=Danaus plexippus plexippus TaxID=278856 RepID=A0A212EJM1_DANPL|nr:cappuccino protein [Danaus plexippus plexippus]